MAILELSSRLFCDIIKHPAVGAALGILSFIKSPSIPHPREKTLGQITGVWTASSPGPKHWLVALGPFSHLDPGVALQSFNREFVESIKKSFTRWKSNNSPETEID